ncbi:MAG: putative nucleic acid-binding Zn-ribbon protein [Polaribacter sp.]|jgi:predicted  nucleic acid-binding Zn-ribbon protein
MSSVNPINTDNFKQKSFWSRPEGITGVIFLAALVAGGSFLLITALPALIALASNILYLAGMLVVLAVIVYMVLDPKMRNLVGYMYKSIMRSITGMFVNIDPVGILKSYVDDLQDNLRKMSKQIGALRGQMRKLTTIMADNSKEIDTNMKLAAMAQKKGNKQQLMLSTRKAARLKETNAKYKALTSKMDVMHKILTRMYQNSEILLEDTKDQVQLKEQERKAIRASHSAMTSAMSVISGDPDKRAMFDAAMEAVADDVANKVGEMERFMDMSANFMNSVDLQNGVFEEEGMKMLEKFEKESTLMLMGDADTSGLDLNAPRATPEELPRQSSSDNSYENLFD